MATTWGGARPGAGRKPNGQKRNPFAKPAAPAAEPKRTWMPSFDEVAALVNASRARKTERTPENNPFRIYEHPAHAMPPKEKRMGMDNALTASVDWAGQQWLGAAGVMGSIASEGLIFLGYPYLSELSQRPEFRTISEIIADDCTREWIDFEVTGGERAKKARDAGEEPDPDDLERDAKENGKLEKVKALKDELTRLDARDALYCMVRDDGFFGRMHLYLNFGDALDGDPAELGKPIGDGRDEMSRGKITKGKVLKELQTIEPVWTYPQAYNAADPLLPTWYKPQQWYVMGREIHRTRLLTMVGRPVPDMLKPAYSFGGLSLTQIAKPYVDIWLTTRQSVADLIHSFSVMVLMTDLSTILAPGNASSLLARVAMFNALRDNEGTFVVNKDTEDFKNVTAPLSGLDQLQAQAQEHICSVVRVPLVKYTGISPHGMNASSEGEIMVYDDTIAAYQNRVVRPPLTTVANFTQLCLWGEVDPEITIKFNELRQMTEKERADLQKADAERHNIYVDMGALSPEEIRKVAIDDPELPYAGLDPEDVPDLREEEEEGLVPGKGGGGVTKELAAGGGGEERGGASDAVLPFAGDNFSAWLAFDAWNEADHPRGQPGNAGQFGSGGGGGGAPAHAPQFGLFHGKFSAAGAAPAAAPKPAEPLDPSKLQKVGGQKGSNPGGVYEEGGKQFYVKKGKSKDHVRNELTAAALYKLAGTPTLRYRPVTGGGHVATEMEDLDKDNAADLSPGERREAQRDFAVHAWLGNWDAVGLGGDNLGTVGGVPTALDLGGALEYRAQGSPKGKAFGNEVGELETLRDPKVNKDAAGVFADMTPGQMRESARYVTRISDAAIEKAVASNGGPKALAEKLIARRDDVKRQARFFGAEGDPESPQGTMVVPVGEKPPVKSLNGIPFKAWRPPADWADVEGQAAIEEPPFDVPKGKTPSSGVVIREPDGRLWLIQPRGGYGGYEATFPKGGVEEGLSPQANAIKEAYEESGLKVRIVSHLGDHAGDSTMTRYYVAEREGGDPSRHDDESDGVVLVPKARASAFLNRTRDRNVTASLSGDELALDALFDDPSSRAEPSRLVGVIEDVLDGGEKGGAAADEFKESDHPRGEGGKFAEVAGGGAAAGKTFEEWQKAGKEAEAATAKKKTAFGGLWKAPKEGESESTNFNSNVGSVLAKPANAGQSYRSMLAFMIKNVAKHGAGEMYLEPLKNKLTEAWVKAAQKLHGEGKLEEAAKIVKQIVIAKPGLGEQMKVILGAAAAAPGTAKPAAPAPKPAPKAAPKSLQEAFGGELPPVPSKFPKPTEAELEKAKKDLPLKLQYLGVQEAPDTPATQAALKKFNDKYAGKALTDPAALEQKVNDFKALQVEVAKMAGGEKLKQLEQQQKQAAAQAKANAEAKVALQKQQAELKAKNAAAMKDLGITEAEATGFNALVEMLGKSGADLVQQFKGYASQAKSLGYTEVSGFEYALIRNYIDGGYGAVNKALRSGTVTPAQHVYTRMVNKALDKFPKYTGTVTRGATLSAEQLASYKPGHVVEERAFTSTGIGFKFGGNVHYTIKANGSRAADFSKGANQGEKEVLFKAHTHFLVHKVENKGGTTHIEMEEVESHG